MSFFKPDNSFLLQKFQKDFCMEEIDFEKIKKDGPFGYSLDTKGQIIGMKTSLELHHLSFDISFLHHLQKLISIGSGVPHSYYSNPFNLSKLKNLTELCICHDCTLNISGLKDLKKLTHLDLSRNQIKDILSLNGPITLTFLDLSENNISNISFLREFKNLVHLNLKSNTFNSLTALRPLKKINYLNLSENKITDISPLFGLTNLTHLYLSWNKIIDISPLKELKNLTHLYLSRNQIIDISPLKELKNLIHLDLSGNQIIGISPLKELKNLIHLDLSGNQIIGISPLKELKNLTHLYLSENRVTDIKSLVVLRKLVLLDIRGNQITELPASIRKLELKISVEDNWATNEGAIYLSNNPFMFKTWKNGYYNVDAYFDSLEKAAATLPEKAGFSVADTQSKSHENGHKKVMIVEKVDKNACIKAIQDTNSNRKNRQDKNKKNGNTTILFLAADPSDASRLRLGEELREIQEKLQLSKEREKFSLHHRMSVRPTDIAQAMLDIQPTIVHFSGHGLSKGVLCFENQQGTTHTIEPDALAELFEQFADHLKCVVLNACYSEVQANAIARHIDYVIGMKRAIGDKAAIAFAIGFYQALGAGSNIEKAYKLGCIHMRLKGLKGHLTPVLIKHS